MTEYVIQNRRTREYVAVPPNMGPFLQMAELEQAQRFPYKSLAELAATDCEDADMADEFDVVAVEGPGGDAHG
jgi:hypothetical protein